MKRVLVTGGAGFIGSNFIQFVLKNNPDVEIVNLDCLTYAGNLNHLKTVEDDNRYHFVKGNINDTRLVKDILEKHQINIIVNFAAESHVDNSINTPLIFTQTNVLGTHNLLECAKQYWMKGKDELGYPTYEKDVLFLQVSTDEVYGSLGKDGFFQETSQIKPNSPYSASKAAADHIVQSYGHTFKLPCNITRCSNNYGPHQHPEKLIPLMITKAMQGEALPVYGDGMQIRDWLYVEDHCSAIWTVVSEGRRGEVYNIGGNNEQYNINIVKRIISQLGASEELITYVQDRLGHDRRYAIDNTKIMTELKWEPAYTFEDGIHDTIEWYRNQV